MGVPGRGDSRVIVLGVLAVLLGATPWCSRADEPPISDLMRKPPYLLYRGDPTQIQVLWQLNATMPSTISWGPDSSCALGRALTSEYTDDHQHSVIITNLVPGTHYEYKVTLAQNAFRGSFAAAPDPSSEVLRFFAEGDTRSDPASHNEVAGGMLAAMAADPDRQSLVLSTGDLVSDGDSEDCWTNEFFAPAATNVLGLLARLPYQCARGNHELSAVLFAKYFPYPVVDGRYWSFDYGPAHFLLMDQYVSYEAGSAQLAWIENDLASTTKEWKFIFLHEPGWSAGPHENNLSVQTLIQPLCVEYGVAIVFAGHNHYYARAVVDGVQHITTAGGGAPLYHPDPSYPNLITCVSAHHFCEVDIDGETLELRAIAPDGTILETFTMQTPSGVEEGGVAAPRAGAFPNPFHTVTTIRWQPEAGAADRLLVQNVAGRTVRSFTPLGTGPQAVRWNGTDELGRPVAAGAYFLHVAGARAKARAGGILLIR